MKNRDFNALDPLPADFLDALNEFISTLAVGFFVQIKPTDATVLQVVAGTGNDQVAIGIEGRWRYNTATVERTSPGGSARTLDVYVTGSDNVFVPGDPGEVDDTVYAFGLSIVEHAALPVGVAIKRLVATAAWSGTAFTSVQHVVGPGLVRAGEAAGGELAGVWPSPIIGALAAARILVWGGDTNLYRQGSGVLKTDGKLQIGSQFTIYPSSSGILSIALATDQLLRNFLVSGDANAAFRLAGDGKHEWGVGGASALDTNLYRAAANILKTDDTLQAALGLFSYPGTSAQINIGNNAGIATIYFGSPADVTLYRAAADVLGTNNLLRITRNVITSVAFSALVGGDAADRVTITAGGKINFGDGTNPQDTNLYRFAADTLKTDDSLIVGGGLTVGADTVRGAHSTLSAQPILDVGVLNQIRAGRVLTVADFTTQLGLSTPVGLFNLGGLTNLGSGGALVNKGSVPFGTGITGNASEAAVFAGSTGQALYIADTGSSDPFRIKTGSWGCWFRTAKRGVNQQLVTKYNGINSCYYVGVSSSNLVFALVAKDAANTGSALLNGVTDVADNRWHFAVATHDGSMLRIYVDGVLEASVIQEWTIFGGTAPFNIGASNADGSTAAANPMFGSIDEAFVTPDVLSPDEIRLLYCAKVAHSYPVTPTRAFLAVRRLRKGGALVTGDFSASPKTLYNFTAGALTDAGQLGATLTNNNAAVAVAGADGIGSGAFSFLAASSQYLSGNDAGLPSGAVAKTMLGWLKTTATTGNVISYGGTTATEVSLFISGSGQIVGQDGPNTVVGPVVNDGQWHSVVWVLDPSPTDGLKMKLYLDGRLVGVSTTALTGTTTLGATGLRIGREAATGTNYFTGAVDVVAITDYAMGAAEIAKLYAKGSQALPASPKDTGAHVEAFDANNVYALFDTLETQSQVDLVVAA